MLKFSEYVIKMNEIVEPLKTTALRRMVTKNGGTWLEKKVVEYRFTTSLGNKVKIHFDKKEENPKTYDVVFYVNDTQYDNASRTENNVRDPEILSRVIYLIKKKSDDLKAEEIHFIAQKGEGDSKVVRNIDVNQYKPIAIFQINKLYDSILNHQVNMISPNKEIYVKLNRPIPPDRPDVDKEKWLRILNNIKQSVSQSKNINVNEIETSIYLDKIGNYFDVSKFIDSIRNFSNAIFSNTESGYIKNKNRRESLYSKLVEKYFLDWDVEKNGDSFKLKRKSI